MRKNSLKSRPRKRGLYMKNDSTGTENNVPESDYAVFYGDSEESARELAIRHIFAESSSCESPHIERPHIGFAPVFKGAVLPSLLIAAIVVAAILTDGIIPVWAAVSACIAVAFIFIKHTFILFVLLYQKLAPESVRGACRFEPSCSNYMLLAIKKYGFARGFVKGLKRLRRCRPPNGGVDYP
jgi:putative membrane protein insertion efficiency factor